MKLSTAIGSLILTWLWGAGVFVIGYHYGKESTRTCLQYQVKSEGITKGK